MILEPKWKSYVVETTGPLFTPEQCQKIIDLGENRLQEIKSKGHTTEATTFGNNHKQAMKDALPQNDKTVEELKVKLGKDVNVEKNRYVRDSEVCWFNDRWLYDLIHPFIRTANKQAGWEYEWDFSESFQFTKYNVGGFYGWHSDGRSCHFGKYKRYIKSATCYLPRNWLVGRE